MFRLNLPSPDFLKTLTACATAVNKCLDADTRMYLEVLPVKSLDSGHQAIKDPEALTKTVGVASGLSADSNARNTFIRRNVHHSGIHEPAPVATEVYDLIHKDASPNTAIGTIKRNRRTHLGVLKGLFT